MPYYKLLENFKGKIDAFKDFATQCGPETHVPLFMKHHFDVLRKTYFDTILGSTLYALIDFSHLAFHTRAIQIVDEYPRLNT